MPSRTSKCLVVEASRVKKEGLGGDGVVMVETGEGRRTQCRHARRSHVESAPLVSWPPVAGSEWLHSATSGTKSASGRALRCQNDGSVLSVTQRRPAAIFPFFFDLHDCSYRTSTRPGFLCFQGHSATR